MNEIYVIGHHNPDTDSIVSAMAYAALRNAQGNIHQSARDIGLTYRIIYYKIKKYGINYHDFLPSPSKGGRKE